jgi:hypothetical protein
MSLEEINNKKTILIAPLNWGLGHATRCIPIIRALQGLNHIPIIASDGILTCYAKNSLFKTLNCLPSDNIC